MKAKSILAKKKFRFEDLPNDVNDPLWTEVRELLGLKPPKQLHLLTALKNERCYNGDPKINGGSTLPVLRDQFELEVLVLMPMDETSLFSISMPQKQGMTYERSGKQCPTANIEKQGRVLRGIQSDEGVVTYPFFQKDIPLLPQIMAKAPDNWFQLLKEPFHNMVLLKPDLESPTRRHLVVSEFDFRMDSAWTIADLEAKGMIHPTANHKVPRLFVAQKDYVEAATLARKEPGNATILAAAQVAKDAVPPFNVPSSSLSSSSMNFLTNTMTSQQKVLANMYQFLGIFVPPCLNSILYSTIRRTLVAPWFYLISFQL